mmetsp:Transcript_17599/g.57077  ORF Transcript_17599/g.57077 Transcript_17599/m.57077 type:complete len:102 (+) Transcript_17599:188-493(+)
MILMKRRRQNRGIHWERVPKTISQPVLADASVCSDTAAAEARDPVVEALERHAGVLLCSRRPKKKLTFPIEQYYVPDVIPEITVEAWVSVQKKKTGEEALQ